MVEANDKLLKEIEGLKEEMLRSKYLNTNQAHNLQESSFMLNRSIDHGD